MSDQVELVFATDASFRLSYAVLSPGISALPPCVPNSGLRQLLPQHIDHRSCANSIQLLQFITLSIHLPSCKVKNVA